MRTVTISLTAGMAKKVSVNGYYLTLIQAAAAIDMEVEMVGKAGSADVSTGIPEGYGEQFPEMFNAVTLTSAISQTIKMGYSLGVVKFDRTTITSQQATTATHATATMTTGAVQMVAADTVRRRIIATAHPNNVGTICLGGGNTLTTANAARRLAAGESFIDEVAAAAALWALSDVAGDVLCIEVAQ